MLCQSIFSSSVFIYLLIYLNNLSMYIAQVGFELMAIIFLLQPPE